MTDRTHEQHTLPKVPTVLKNETTGFHQTSHMDNESAKRDSDQYVSNFAGDSRKELKNSNNSKKVRQSKMVKDSKSKKTLPSVKGRKKASTTRDDIKAPKRNQKAPKTDDPKKRKTEKATSKNENTTLKEEDEVYYEETPTISGEQDENIGRDEENTMIADLTDDYDPQNEEIIQTPPERVENQNIQATENSNKIIKASSNPVKGTEEIISMELNETGLKIPQKRSASKPTAKPKAKTPKKSKPQPVNKKSKKNLKTKQIGQKRKK